MTDDEATKGLGNVSANLGLDNLELRMLVAAGRRYVNCLDRYTTEPYCDAEFVSLVEALECAESFLNRSRS